jgi:hypothetical protein
MMIPNLSYWTSRPATINVLRGLFAEGNRQSAVRGCFFLMRLEQQQYVKVEGAPPSRFPFPDYGVAGPKLCKARPHPLSPQPTAGRTMTDRVGIAGLQELRAYRLRCDCWAVLPLAELVSHGKR